MKKKNLTDRIGNYLLTEGMFNGYKEVDDEFYDGLKMLSSYAAKAEDKEEFIGVLKRVQKFLLHFAREFSRIRITDQFGNTEKRIGAIRQSFASFCTSINASARQFGIPHDMLPQPEDLRFKGESFQMDYVLPSNVRDFYDDRTEAKRKEWVDQADYMKK